MLDNTQSTPLRSPVTGLHTWAAVWSLLKQQTAHSSQAQSTGSSRRTWRLLQRREGNGALQAEAVLVPVKVPKEVQELVQHLHTSAVSTSLGQPTLQRRCDSP